MILERRQLTINLQIALAAATGRPVGVLNAPDPAANPYGIIYPIPGGSFSGPAFVAPDEDVAAVYQVTSVGKTAEQADAMADRVRAAMLARDGAGAFLATITAPSGWQIIGRAPDAGPPGMDDDTGGTEDEFVVVSVPERFVLHLTPS